MNTNISRSLSLHYILPSHTFKIKLQKKHMKVIGQKYFAENANI